MQARPRVLRSKLIYKLNLFISLIYIIGYASNTLGLFYKIFYKGEI